MTVAATRADIVAMCKQITGLGKVHPNIPRVIQDAELPAVIVFPRRSDYNLTDYGETMVGKPRLYDVVCYIKKVSFGTEEEGETALEPFIERVANHFLARPGLEIDGESLPREVVFDVRVIGDEGIQALPYPPIAEADVYWATTTHLMVEEIEDIAYQD